MDSTQKLFKLGLEARKKAYAPYSNFLVGSAVLFSNGEITSGCNIENISYGGTICAERVAITKGISETPKVKIKEISVVTDNQTGDPPCGLCMQVIAEFATPETLVHLCNLKGPIKSVPFTDIMPLQFSSDLVKK